MKRKGRSMKEIITTEASEESIPVDTEEDSLSEGGDLKGATSGIIQQEEWAQELRSKDREIEALADRLLRLQAEFENYKKRMTKERAELVKYANEGLLTEIIPVIDSLDRAIESARQNARMEDLLNGLELIRRLFSVFMERAGIKEIRAYGQGFDPQLHEAISVIESVAHPENTVVEEVQRGYILNGRVLRPAMVKVAKPTTLEDPRDGSAEL